LCLSDPILLELDPSAPPPSGTTVGDVDAQRQDLHKNILDAAVELRALLAQTHVRLSDVLDMQPGDVITTEQSATDEVQVQVEGKKKLQGQMGQLHGNRVVQITRLPRMDDATDAAAPPAAPPAPRDADDSSRSGDRS
jgi:flagellar motor switch protein FliM